MNVADLHEEEGVAWGRKKTKKTLVKSSCSFYRQSLTLQNVFLCFEESNASY